MPDPTLSRPAMRVPAMDLKAQHAALRRELEAAVGEVIASGAFILGPKVQAFEQEIARLTGTKHAIGVGSGTDALALSLRGFGIGPGDEVITSAYSFIASASSIAMAGARPVFVDIDAATFNLDPDRLSAAITDRTRAIMPVHLFGQCADMDPVLAIAARHDLRVIEDAAQALGATDRGRQAGSMGDTGCFSFYPTKNLGGMGDGGIIVTNDDDLADRIRLLRVHGSRPKYVTRILGTNSRLDSLQAAILLVKLPHLADWTARRRRHAHAYTASFAGSPVRAPAERPDVHHIYNQYALRVPDRDNLAKALAERGVGTAVYYPGVLPLQEALKDLGHRPGDFPLAEQAARENLCLPIFPELTDAERDYVTGEVLALAGRG